MTGLDPSWAAGETPPRRSRREKLRTQKPAFICYNKPYHNKASYNKWTRWAAYLENRANASYSKGTWSQNPRTAAKEELVAGRVCRRLWHSSQPHGRDRTRRNQFDTLNPPGDLPEAGSLDLLPFQRDSLNAHSRSAPKIKVRAAVCFSRCHLKSGIKF